MIKELGTLGLFIKFNESASTSFKFIEIFSSSAMTTSVFSASTNSSKNIVIPSTASTFINGQYGTSVYDDEWLHLTFIFDPKLKTVSSANFVVRLGDTQKANFQIQNIYILDNLLDTMSIYNIHNAFNGDSAYVVGGDSSSASLKIVDRDEAKHTSSSTYSVYQPYLDQSRFLTDVAAVTELSASAYTSVGLSRTAQFFDGVKVVLGDRILSTLDNKVYEVQSNSTLLEISSSNGDYVHVTNGVEFYGFNFLKSNGVFAKAPFLEKVATIESSQQ